MLLDNGTIIKCFTQYSASIKFTEGDYIVCRNESTNSNSIYEVTGVHGSDYVVGTVPPDSRYYTLYASPAFEGISGLKYLTDELSFIDSSDFLRFISSNRFTYSKVTKSIAHSVFGDFQVLDYDPDSDYYCLTFTNQLGIDTVLIDHGGSYCLISDGTHYRELNINNTIINICDFTQSPPRYLTTNTELMNLATEFNKYINLSQYGFNVLEGSFNEDTYSINDIHLNDDTYWMYRVFVGYERNGLTNQESIDVMNLTSPTTVEGVIGKLNVYDSEDGIKFNVETKVLFPLTIYGVLGLKKVIVNNSSNLNN